MNLFTYGRGSAGLPSALPGSFSPLGLVVLCSGGVIRPLVGDGSKFGVGSVGDPGGQSGLLEGGTEGTADIGFSGFGAGGGVGELQGHPDMVELLGGHGLKIGVTLLAVKRLSRGEVWRVRNSVGAQSTAVG